MSGTRNDQPMGTPAYFVTLIEGIRTGYQTGSLQASPRRRSLVNGTAPKNVKCWVEGGRILLTVAGEKVTIPNDSQRHTIAYWNRRFINEVSVDRIDTIKWELRAYLVGLIEEHLIFRELGGEEESPLSGFQHTDGHWNAKGVGDEEET